MNTNDPRPYGLHLGLNDREVIESRAKYGENTLTPPKRASLWKLYLDKYRDPIIQILLVAAVVSLVLAFFNGEFIEVIGIFIAIFLATSIGFYFERDAAKKFNVLTALGEEQPVKVRRDGQVVEIPRKEVVVGDVVLIEVGDEIPADGELFASVDLQVDESSLTGEPIANKFSKEESVKQAEAATGHPEAGAYPPFQTLRSTMVMAGRGEFVVTAIGDATEIGKVARESTELVAIKTPLNMQLDKLAKLISKVGSAVAIVAFIVFLGHDILTNDAVWRGANYLKMAETVLQYFMMAVTLLVMAVPEGLPMAVTLSLALNMRRMLKSNNLVRKLHAAETMGAVTVICTDKTGTLTENKMQVGEMLLSRDGEGDETAEKHTKELLAKAIAINSTAELNEDKAIGNPTEGALLFWLRKQGIDYAPLREGLSIVEQLPFSTERKFMATITKVDGREMLFVKGAPEIVLNYCDLTPERRKRIDKSLLGFQNKAMRTLAFACQPLQGDDFDRLDHKERQLAMAHPAGLSFQAIAAISDPIRADVPPAVAECQGAGIEVKVVTGDTSATAIEIARQIGTWEGMGEDDWHITGAEWAALTDEEAHERAKDLRVMSRARPTDKQRLVECLKDLGEVVAVTGDGTNDAPALHHAHVGLSLGTGTSVAKEASDMTLLDDSFASIANAVMWGRSLYKNIQRFLFFQLVVNVTALLLVLGGAVIGTEMPLTVTQILWVNLIMDTFAALALASLPPSHEVMKAKPRKQTDFIINKGMGNGIIFVGITFFLLMFAMLLYYQGTGGTLHVHQLTIFFTTFVMLQFWNLFNAKSLGSAHSAFRHFVLDKGLLLVLVIILAGQWFIVQFGGRMFRTTPLSLNEWLVIIASTSVVLWVGEIYRLVQRMRS